MWMNAIVSGLFALRECLYKCFQRLQPLSREVVSDCQFDHAPDFCKVQSIVVQVRLGPSGKALESRRFAGARDVIGACSLETSFREQVSVTVMLQPGQSVLESFHRKITLAVSWTFRIKSFKR